MGILEVTLVMEVGILGGNALCYDRRGENMVVEVLHGNQWNSRRWLALGNFEITTSNLQRSNEKWNLCIGRNIQFNTVEKIMSSSNRRSGGYWRGNGY